MSEQMRAFRRSEQFGEFAKALLNARSSMGTIEKTTPGQKGNQKYMYADLPTVYAEALPALHNNNIVHMQSINQRDGYVTVTTLLYHTESDQWAEQDTSFTYDEKAGFAGDPKELGLKATHIRRYSFVAMIGHIAGGDDDEEKIEKLERRKQPSNPQRQTPKNGNGEADTLKRAITNTMKQHATVTPETLARACNQLFDVLGKDKDSVDDLKDVQTRLNQKVENGDDLLVWIEKNQLRNDLRSWIGSEPEPEHYSKVLEAAGMSENDKPTLDVLKKASAFCRKNVKKNFDESVSAQISEVTA